jgi:monomeric sarcosine oxidase
MQISTAQRTSDVVVIGAGVFGAWIAYHLRRSGKRVVLIDAYGAGNSRSSSGGESRIMRMGYGGDEVYTSSAQRALHLWREFFAQIGEDLFQQTGVLWLAHADDPYSIKSAETLHKFKIPFEKLTPSEVTQRFPQLRLDEISWAAFEPGSGVIMARRAVQALVREAINLGVLFLHKAVQPPDGRQRPFELATTDGQRISAGAYVFACGPWLPKLFPGLLADRIHPTRQEVFFFGTPSGDCRFTLPSLPAWIDFKDEAYALPDLERRGLKVAIDRHGQLFDPDDGSRVVSAEGLHEVRQYLARRLPDLKDAPVIETRVCQYENTSNGDFLIDRHPDFENVWLAGGGSGHGFKHGPVVGEYVSARIDGSREGIEPRFSLATKARDHRRSVF